MLQEPRIILPYGVDSEYSATYIERSPTDPVSKSYTTLEALPNAISTVVEMLPFSDSSIVAVPDVMPDESLQERYVNPLTRVSIPKLENSME